MRGILLDIEGTTSAIGFVYDVLMPYAAARLPDYAQRHWHDAPVLAARNQAAAETNAPDLADDRDRLVTHWLDLARRDVKATSLKAMQGLIWQEGYAAGELSSHVYDDVPPALKAWRQRGLDVRIYSSGSVTAQKAFFARTRFGDLLPLLNGHYDTTTGPKKSPDSYQRIAADMALPPAELLFVSDLVDELDAALAAGLHTRLCVRDAPPPDPRGHTVIATFDQIAI